MEPLDETIVQEPQPQAGLAQEELAMQTPARRRGSWIAAALALVIVLGAAAFLAGRLMNRPEVQAGLGRGSGPRIAISKGGPGGSGVPIELDIKPAAELPQTPPDAAGILTKRKDNSLFIGTGSVTIAASGDGKVDTNYDGPVVEVVVTQDTRIYRDVTQIDPDNLAESLQQQVELATLEDIAGQASISAWGRKVGDRVIADVLFYSQPFLMVKPSRSAGGD